MDVFLYSPGFLGKNDPSWGGQRAVHPGKNAAYRGMKYYPGL